MKYDYEDPSDIPDLQTFKLRLVEDLFMSAFFQHRSDQKYNMLKLPIIAPPSVIGKQVNNEYKKKTLMEKSFEYTEETLATFIQLIDEKKLKINKIQNLSSQDLRDLSVQLGIYHKDKTGEIIRTDLLNLSKIFLAGQGVCHKYIYERGRTGGFQDMHCSHRFKVLFNHCQNPNLTSTQGWVWQ